VAAVAADGLASPLTTSAGRLFDAVAAICGLRPTVAYEGQAAVELEWAAASSGTGAVRGAYPFPAASGEATDADAPDAPAIRLDAREAVLRAAADVERGEPVGVVGARFHAGLATGTASMALREAQRRGLDTVVLSGGVFQNRVLLERVAGHLTEGGVRVLWPRRLPPNDGGIAYGQAAVAASRMARSGAAPGARRAGTPGGAT
jgi:hydrogenase maturation protein HypF